MGSTNMQPMKKAMENHRTGIAIGPHIWSIHDGREHFVFFFFSCADCGRRDLPQEKAASGPPRGMNTTDGDQGRMDFAVR